jgi:hypothetical protein
LREFGDLEMAIMEVMWASDGPHVVREVRERLRYGRPVAYTTVMTMRRFLERVSDDEMRSLCGALAAAPSRRRGVPEACRPADSVRGRGTSRIRTPTRT